VNVGNRTKLLYGTGAFGYGAVGQTIGSFLMFFGTGVLGIPGTLMGLAVGISTVWDATTDPIVGHWSDKVKSRFFGKRHGFILFGGIAVALANILIWNISPSWDTASKFWSILVLLLVLETFNTCYSTPYGALGLDLTEKYDDRTAIQNYKTAFSFLSLMVPSLLMVFLLKDARNTGGYVSIAIVTSALCILSAIICFLGTYKHRPISREEVTPEPQKENLFEDFFGIIKQKNVGRLIAGYAISLSAGAFLTSLGLHVFTYTFHFTTMQIPIIMLCLVAGIIIGQPFWYYLSRRTDKVMTLLTALGMLLVCMIVFSSILIFRSSVSINTALVYMCFAIFASGVGTGCLYSIPISMFADCIAKHQQETGTDKTGKSAGFLTFCTKISNAVVLFIIGLSLDIIGFNAVSGTQSISVQNWLGWFLVAGVTIACVAATFVYCHYSYTKHDFAAETTKTA
jgi:Na+/melibiose symporter-like transporter